MAEKELRLAKRTFNVVSVALIDQLLGIFGASVTLNFMRDEITRFSKVATDSHVPAVKYFETMNIVTKVAPSADRTTREPIVVGELVVRKDPIVFTDEVGVTIPELEALGMKDKWPRLTPANKEMVWDYLIRMAKTSAQVVIGMQMVSGNLPRIMDELNKKGVAARPGMTEQQYSEFVAKVKQACEDK